VAAFQRFGWQHSLEYAVGLGLALCKAIVEAHGGIIRADNRIGKGAEFVIEMPLHEPPGLAEPDFVEHLA
jgi:two-component system sensor histidine kinase KdpD